MSFNKKSEDVWMPYGRGLGDTIHSLSVYLDKSIANQEVTRVSSWFPKGEGRRTCAYKWNELMPLIVSAGRIEITDDAATKRHHWTEGGLAQCPSTTTLWNINSFESKKVTYQFDGKSHGSKNFASKEKEEFLLKAVVDAGLEPVRVGGHISLEEGMKTIAASKFFIGVDSGFSHFAHCVGIPVLLVRNGFTVERITHLHTNKHFILADNEEDAAVKVGKISRNKIDWYIDKCFFKDKFTNSLKL